MSEIIKTHEPVSFEDINPLNLEFSLKFQCAKSMAGQVVQAIYHLSKMILGKDEYAENQKLPTNKFQESLYPIIVSLSQEIVNDYLKTFINDTTDSVDKQVFGANLNGYKNNGQLNKFIPYKGTENKFLRYEFAQFGQLVNLLHYRLTFITMRDGKLIKRYAENEKELESFEKLKSLTQQFCSRLKNKTDESYLSVWTKAVDNIHKQVDETENVKKENVKKHDVYKICKECGSKVKN
jgi:hypothetical protein